MNIVYSGSFPSVLQGAFLIVWFLNSFEMFPEQTIQWEGKKRHQINLGKVVFARVIGLLQLQRELQIFTSIFWVGAGKAWTDSN